MAIKFACECGKTIKAPDEKVGKKVECPACGDMVTVPEAAEAEESPVASVGSAGSAAGDLMKRAAAAEKEQKKSSRKSGRDTREDEDKASVTDVAAYLGVKIVPWAAGLVVAVVVVYWLSSTMFNKDSGMPPLGIVKGKVTIDGQPLPRAMVMFRPVEGDRQPGPGVKASAVSNSLGITDAGGNYSLMYVQDHPGAAVGEHQVVITAQNENGMEIVSMKYRTDPNLRLKATVKSGGNEPKNFDLKSEP